MPCARSGPAAAAALSVLVLAVAACGGGEAPPASGGQDDSLVAPSAGDVSGRVHLEPGPAAERTVSRNPHADDSEALARGRRLYAWYNCAGCHGPNGGGSIGPSLRDGEWVHGGDPGSVFRSIWDGLPEGMPTWRGRIPEEDVWKIVAFVRSLEGGSPVEILPEGDDG